MGMLTMVMTTMVMHKDPGLSFAAQLFPLTKRTIGARLNPIVPPKRNKQHSLLDFTTVSAILCPAEKEDGIVKMQHRAVKFNLDGATSYQSFAQG